MTTYNGWTNYATWKINLEAVDHDYWRETAAEQGWDSNELAEILEGEVSELILFDASENSVAHSITASFLADVDWWEIADSIINEG